MNADIILLIVGFLLMLAGIAGAILPVIPGTPISWLGLLMIYLTSVVAMDWWFLGITGFIAISIYILDYIIPAIGTKKMGGSKAGAWGAIIGLFAGIIAPIPFGIIIGPFAGAFIGELLVTKSDSKVALKAALGSFIGFLSSTLIKLLATGMFLLLFIYKVIAYKDVLFA